MKNVKFVKVVIGKELRMYKFQNEQKIGLYCRVTEQAIVICNSHLLL